MAKMQDFNKDLTNKVNAINERINDNKQASKEVKL